MIKQTYKLNLQLFNEGGAAAGAASTGAGEAAASGNSGVATTKSGKEQVIYGKQQLADNEQNQVATEKTNNKPMDRNAEFENLIKGDYKQEFDNRVKSILDRRFKDVQALNDYKTQSGEIIDLLATKYGVKNGDLKALTQAIQSDDTYFEDAAADEGLTVEQYKHKLQLEKENQALKAAQANAERTKQAQQIYAGWMNEAEQLKQIYPNFSFDNEVRNPNFMKMLQSGVSLKAAFSAVHADEIIPQAMMQTAEAVKKNVTENIRAKGLRPQENGIAQQAGIIVKNDVTKLTAKDRAEIARRARMGENITF